MNYNMTPYNKVTRMKTFNVGDRVQLICDSTCGGDEGDFGLKGQLATILERNNHPDPGVNEWYVLFDEPVPYSHKYEEDPDNHWYVKGDEIELYFEQLQYDPTQQGDKDEDI